jgi:serine/threonine protein kinase
VVPPRIPEYQRCPQCADPPKVYNSKDVATILRERAFDRHRCFVCIRCKLRVHIGQDLRLVKPPKVQRATTRRNPRATVSVMAESGDNITLESVGLEAGPSPFEGDDTVAIPKLTPKQLDLAQAKEAERDAESKRNLRRLQVMSAFIDAIEQRRVLGGRFKLTGVLARGARNIVASGVDVKTNVPVIVKCQPDTALEGEDSVEPIERFKGSVNIQQRMAGPNVLPVLGVVRGSFGYLLVEPFVEGKTLTKLVEEQGFLSEVEVRRIGIVLASVLQRSVYKTVIEGKTCRICVVHRDIKPDNIIVRPDGEVILIDWNISRDSEDAHDNPSVLIDDVPAIDPALYRSTLTQVDTVLGTPNFMAPEQVDGAAIDTRTDLYSLGATLYYALTGRYPLDAESLPLLLDLVVTKHPPPACSVRRDPPISKQMSDLLSKSLEKDRLRRFQTPEEFVLALTQEARPSKSRGNGFWWLCLLLTLLMLIASAWRQLGYPTWW